MSTVDPGEGFAQAFAELLANDGRTQRQIAQAATQWLKEKRRLDLRRENIEVQVSSWKKGSRTPELPSARDRSTGAKVSAVIEAVLIILGQHRETHEAWAEKIQEQVARAKKNAPGPRGGDGPPPPSGPAGRPLVTPGKIVVGEIPGEPPGWVQRVELDDLAAAGAATGRVVVCAGGRGVGKSALAGAYVRAQIVDPAGPRVIVWVNGETLESLVSGLALLAAEVVVADPDGDDEKSAAAARHYLTGLAEPSMLVIDNAEHPAAVAPWLPTGRCRVVLTSTDRRFTELGDEIPLGGFTRQQSIAYLEQRTGLDDPGAADGVAEELGDLPLALAQAAAVIRSRKLTYPAYLDRLAAAGVQTMFPAAGTYPRGLAAAINLSIQAALDREHHVRPLLDVIAVLDPAGVARDLLTDLAPHLTEYDGEDATENGKGLSDVTDSPTAGWGRVNIDAGLGALADASLVTWTADGTGVVMHRLVSRVIREGNPAPWRPVSSPSRVVTATAWALADVLTAIETYQPGAVFVAAAAGHALALHAHAKPDQVDGDVAEEVADALSRVSSWLFGRGFPTAELALDEVVVAVREKLLGPEHPDTLFSRSNLAADYFAVGRYEAAITLDEAISVAREKLLGPEHPDTLFSRSNLAADYRSVGRYEGAITLDEAISVAREKLLGPEHPDTLLSRSNLAADYRSVGRYDEAIALHEATLVVSERVLGAEHPDTLTCRSNLAGDYFAVGRYEEAIALHEATLVVSERMLGAEHPDTLTCRSNLAGDYFAVGRYQEAIALDEMILAVREKVLGAEHPHTLTSRSNLAGDYFAAGRYQEAMALDEMTLAVREKVLGTEHPHTLTSRNNLAAGCRALGRYQEAIALDEAAVAAFEKVLGPEHPDTLTSSSNLAADYFVVGRYEEAIALHEAALAARERVLGPEHQHTLTSRSNLGADYRAVGRLEEAIAQYEATLPACERALGPEHPLTSQCRRSLEAARAARTRGLS